MLVIRLSRTGRKKQPYYRVVVAEKSAPVKGHYIEVLGNYNPRTKDLTIDVDRAKERLAKGAQPSETAEALLEKAGVLKREAVTEQNRRPTRKKRKDAAAEAEGAASAGEQPPAQDPAEAATAQKAEPGDEKPESKPKAGDDKADKAKAEQPANAEQPDAKKEKGSE